MSHPATELCRRANRPWQLDLRPLAQNCPPTPRNASSTSCIDFWHSVSATERAPATAIVWSGSAFYPASPSPGARSFLPLNPPAPLHDRHITISRHGRCRRTGPGRAATAANVYRLVCVQAALQCRTHFVDDCTKRTTPPPPTGRRAQIATSRHTAAAASSSSFIPLQSNSACDSSGLMYCRR